MTAVPPNDFRQNLLQLPVRVALGDWDVMSVRSRGVRPSGVRPWRPRSLEIAPGPNPLPAGGSA